MRRFASVRQRRIALFAAVLGNVVPVILLGTYHQSSQTHNEAVVGIGTTLAIISPLAVNLIPLRRQMLIRVFAFAGIVGLTMMQADTGGVGSGYAILFALPMIWFGLSVGRAELWWVAALVLACCLLPMWVWPEEYPREIRPALALATVSLAVLLSLAAAIREVSRLTDQLRHEATHDRLTGLLNRRGWEDVTERAMASVTDRVPVCVLLVDLDRLKHVNDTMGHDEGDRALRETADRLTTAFDSEAALCRLGGDEFAALLVDSTTEQVLDRLDRLRLVTPELGAFSVGLALMGPREQLGDAMRRADLALYEAKTTGRGRACVADQPLAGQDV